MTGLGWQKVTHEVSTITKCSFFFSHSLGYFFLPASAWRCCLCGPLKWRWPLFWPPTCPGTAGWTFPAALKFGPKNTQAINFMFHLSRVTAIQFSYRHDDWLHNYSKTAKNACLSARFRDAIIIMWETGTLTNWLVCVRILFESRFVSVGALFFRISHSLTCIEPHQNHGNKTEVRMQRRNKKNIFVCVMYE